METNNIEITISHQQAHELWDILERIRDEYERQASSDRKESIFITLDGIFAIYRSEIVAIYDIIEKLRKEFNE